MLAEDEPDVSRTQDQDELDHYLNTEANHKVKNPLRWWHENAFIYPCLSRMALDCLTIPGLFYLLKYTVINANLL